MNSNGMKALCHLLDVMWLVIYKISIEISGILLLAKQINIFFYFYIHHKLFLVIEGKEKEGFFSH